VEEIQEEEEEKRVLEEDKEIETQLSVQKQAMLDIRKKALELKRLKEDRSKGEKQPKKQKIVIPEDDDDLLN